MMLNPLQNEHLTVGEVAKRLGVKSAHLTRLFYDGVFRDDICPIVCGRRIIPTSYLPEIRAALKRRGYAVNDERKGKDRNRE